MTIIEVLGELGHSAVVFVAAKVTLNLPQSAEESVFYVDPETLELAPHVPGQKAMFDTEEGSSR